MADYYEIDFDRLHGDDTRAILSILRALDLQMSEARYSELDEEAKKYWRPVKPTRKYLSYDEAVAMIPDSEQINVLYGGISPGRMNRSEVLELLRDGKPELSGIYAEKRGYGICAYQNMWESDDGTHGSPVFIETKITITIKARG